jgi:hypothetical protein
MMEELVDQPPKHKTTRKQVQVSGCTAQSIMQHPHFERGLNDIRAGRPFADHMNSWAYERGRLFGAIAPLAMPLFVNGRLNPKAVRLFNAAGERGLIL